jgi:hypothetical protein
MNPKKVQKDKGCFFTTSMLDGLECLDSMEQDLLEICPHQKQEIGRVWILN